MRHARGREIDRFIETVLAFVTGGSEALQIRAGFGWHHHQRHRAGIWRDDQIIGQAAFEAQAGHTKSTVLIVHLRIGEVVTRLTNAPRNTTAATIINLATHHCAARLI